MTVTSAATTDFVDIEGHGVPRPLSPLPSEWRSLSHAFIKQARLHPSRIAMRDSTGAKLTYGETFLRAAVLSRVLARDLGSEDYVGLILPPMVPSAVANLALGLLGKIPVNLNFTTNQAMIDSAIEQCGIRQVVTSARVLDKCQMQPKAELILLEDVPPRVKLADKLWGAAVSRFAPESTLGKFLPGLVRRGLDDLATVIFTSGSTGEPKGVMLSHRNILSNVHQIEEQIHLHENEVILGILPFFHSFGFTVGLWTPLALGKCVVYHFNPLDARTIGKLCEDHDVTLIAGTPSFTRFYLKNCRPEQFRTLTHLLLGAEKLKPETYRDINETLKIEPMEGYGTTELSPVVAVNIPAEMDLGAGRTIYGNRPGTVGIPVPGTSVKTICPDTGADLPKGAVGMICVKGPQVMLGYLNKPEATAKVLRDGWYSTGDLGFVDPDGFLKITDRLSRFSKIAGEMVPHVGVESAIMEATGVDEHHVAVTSLPDPKHGERICVLYTDLGVAPDEVHRRLMAAGVPRLWIPSVRDFVRVDEIPITGTGKIDLRSLRDLAQKQPVA
ncbi:MAG: AMP-binding protein [Paludisphaera borealis]|uniref:AMP-binding protein n=1 Tax=Paludisphaera borealis TaxID=1387353 RepID=UPI002844FB8B|nr:AMP-binding protein [Paludisphaera borealis]MDR3622425.1 AMP-binding protein [Paludisphaera borealis]